MTKTTKTKSTKQNKSSKSSKAEQPSKPSKAEQPSKNQTKPESTKASNNKTKPSNNKPSNASNKQKNENTLSDKPNTQNIPTHEQIFNSSHSPSNTNNNSSDVPPASGVKGKGKKKQGGGVQPLSVVQTALAELQPFSSYTTELQDVFLPLSEAKYAELLASIGSKGIVTPVTVWRGFVVDGHHRLQAARDLGFSVVPCNHRDDLSSAEAEALYVELNYARRQLTAKEKAKAAAALAAILEKNSKKASKPIQAPEGEDDFLVTVGAHGSSNKEASAEEGKPKGKVKGKGKPTTLLTADDTVQAHEASQAKANEGKPAPEELEGEVDPGDVEGGEGEEAPEGEEGKPKGKRAAKQEAAKRLGVGERQFETLAQAGSAPAPVVDAIGESGGFTVAEAAKIGKAASDPRTAPKVEAAVEAFKEAKAQATTGENEDALQEARKGVLEASNKPSKGIAPTKPQTGLLDGSTESVERDQSTMLEGKVEPSKGRLAIYDHNHPKTPVLLVLNFAPLQGEDPAYAYSRLSDAINLAQTMLDRIAEV